MKAPRILCCLLFIALASHSLTLAQLQRDTWMFGTSLGNLSFVLGGGNTQINFAISPDIAYLPVEGLAIGAKPYFSMSNFWDDGVRSSGLGFGIGIFTRYYIPLTPKLKLPLELEYGLRHYQTSGPNNATQTWGTELSSRAGLAYFLSDYVSIEGTLGYFRQTTLLDAGPVARGGLSSLIGFSIFLPPKPKAQ